MEQQDSSSDFYWSKLEKIYVHDVYENISSKYDEFLSIKNQEKRKKRNISLNDSFEQSVTSCFTKQFSVIELKEKGDSSKKDRSIEEMPNQKKQNVWPRIKDFLTKLEPGSFIADIGCGDGKYLSVNSQVFSVGCDRSVSLSHLALSNSVAVAPFYGPNQILICDNLAIPIRSNIFDYVISIGVLHHLSTQKRRAKAIQELVRILKPGGRILIYVWAMEQKIRKFKSQDVLIPMLRAEKSIETKCETLFGNLNNSEGNSEDSLEEKSTQVNIQKNDRFQSESHENIIKNEKSSNSVEINSECTILSKEDVPSQNEDKSNFIESFKKYVKRKFSSKNLLEDLSEIPQKGSKEINEENTKCSLRNQDSIESYKSILENFKDILPEDFDLRKFPSSSCSDTFEINGEIGNEHLNTLNKTSNSISLKSSYFSAISAPANQRALPSKESKNDFMINGSGEDLKNSLNRRFYHVFKKNELDKLLKENCPDMIAYDSYYDHGNWCICAQKFA